MPELKLTKKVKKAIRHYVIDGCNKSQATIRAGLSINTRNDVFYRNDLAKKELASLMDKINKNITEENLPLIEFYRDIINAAPGEVWETHVLRRNRKARKGDTSPEDVLISWDETSKPITVAHKLIAAKELSILLGLREEKTKINVEDDFITEVQKRREQLSKPEEE